MWLVVGLGNPGDQYMGTRHNVGFTAIDAVAKAETDFTAWRMGKKWNALVSSGTMHNEPVALAKPQTFMNLSGNAIQALVAFRKLSPNNVIVIHDEVDLPVGTIRIQKGGSAAGHHGIESIIASVGHDFIRVRIGVANAKNTPAGSMVLKPFSNTEKEIISKVLDRVTKAVESIIVDGLPKAMSLWNGNIE